MIPLFLHVKGFLCDIVVVDRNLILNVASLVLVLDENSFNLCEIFLSDKYAK